MAFRSLARCALGFFCFLGEAWPNPSAAASAKAPQANAPQTNTPEKWQGTIPKIAEKPDAWLELLPLLMDQGMHYGALAGAQSMLNFFSDMPSKELAYRTIVDLIDRGYPFSTRTYFVPGDLDPSGLDPFAQSYLVYKGIVNLDKKMEKWADYYFSKVDKEKFPKYLFFKATQAYQEKNLPEAVGFLKSTLANLVPVRDAVLAEKAARTLARIYYEQSNFQKSLEIYQTYLLQLNPMNPDDWLEGAWNLYRLKMYPEALGLLYNFESKSSGSTRQIEKYVLRALVYREFCSTEATQALMTSFEKEWGSAIDGIKLGQPLANFPGLVRLGHPETQEYRQFTQTIVELSRESKMLKLLPRGMRELAGYIYSSELNHAVRRKKMLEDPALEALARHLVILGESLRFLKFDVAREKFNPDRVFMDVASGAPLIDSTDDKNFRLHWVQWGDFWRDERMLYRGILENKCLP